MQAMHGSTAVSSGVHAPHAHAERVDVRLHEMQSCANRSTSLARCLSPSLSIYLSTHLSVCLSVDLRLFHCSDFLRDEAGLCTSFFLSISLVGVSLFVSVNVFL